MATITPRGPHQWRAQIRRKGFPVRSRTFETYKEAKAWATREEARFADDDYIDRTPLRITTVADLISDYRKKKLPEMKGKDQIESRLDLWEKRLGSARSLASVCHLDFQEFADERRDDDIAPSTIRRDLSVIQAVLKFGRVVQRLPISESLFEAALYGLPKSAERSRRLSPAEEKSLIAEANRYSEGAAHLILLDIETGMRRGEISSLRWEDVHLSAVPENCHIFLSADRTKNGTSRIIPLSDAAIALLRARPRGIRKALVFPSISKADSVTQAFSRIRERAGIQDLCFHDLRHEAASRIAPVFQWSRHRPSWAGKASRWPGVTTTPAPANWERPSGLSGSRLR